MNAKRIFTGSLAIASAMVLAAPARAGMREAKKEGEIVWYSSLSLPLAQAVCNNWNKKKTGVKCILHRSGSGKIYRRYLQEAKGGIFRADVYHTSNIGHFFKLKKKGYFKNYRPKGTEKFDPAFQTKDAVWTILRAFTIAPAYNTTKVKESEVPKSWKDFLDSRWKGRLIQANPNYSGATTVAMIAMVKMFGLDYYKKLARLKPKITGSSASVPAIVARGEAHMAVGGASYSLFNAIQRGEPLKMFVPKEGVPFVVAPNSLLSKAPHPNAAVVFINFLFSKEVQQFLANKGLYVGHPDVKYPKGLDPLGSFKRIMTPPTEVKKKTKEMRKAFRKIFGV